MAERLEVRVAGRVQGVAFRWYTVRQAVAIGVTGCVRNLPDGSVLIVAEGEREALERLLVWARSGPPHARVDHAEVRWGAAQGEFSDFTVLG